MLLAFRQDFLRYLTPCTPNHKKADSPPRLSDSSGDVTKSCGKNRGIALRLVWRFALDFLNDQIDRMLRFSYTSRELIDQMKEHKVPQLRVLHKRLVNEDVPSRLIQYLLHVQVVLEIMWHHNPFPLQDRQRSNPVPEIAGIPDSRISGFDILPKITEPLF